MTKETKAPLPSLGANKLLDLLIDRGNLKNDAALSRALKVAPPVISKLRTGTLQVGPSMLIKVMRKFGLTLPELDAVLAVPA